MNDQTLEPQQSGDMMQQVVRRSPMLGSLLGALAHTAVCWLALQLDFFRGGEDLFYQIIALVWSGYLVFGAVFLLGLNRSLRDPSMVLPIMIWSTLSLLLTAYYIDQVRLCVMVMFFAIHDENTVPQQFDDWVALVAPAKFVTLGDQNFSIRFWTNGDCWLKFGHCDLKNGPHVLPHQ